MLDNADAGSFWFTVAICFLLTIIQMYVHEPIVPACEHVDDKIWFHPMMLNIEA